MKVAMIGTGLQARRRAPPILDSREHELVFVASADGARGREFAQKYAGGVASGDWKAAIARDDVDAVVICTTPESHAEIGIAALQAGKHVLCEKPLTRTLAEAEALVAAAERSGRVLKCGFNHRHHPALQRARQIIDAGGIGRPIIGRSRYGICGRPDYGKEWRADAARSAGGQLMELGIHAIDLFRWYFGDVSDVACMTATQFFPIAPFEDNGMLIMRTTGGGLCSLHSSLTQWKNLFSFEITGEDGYITIEGLGASYGTQTLTVGKREFDGPFGYEVTEFRGGDRSWHGEWDEFVAAIAERRSPIGNGNDGLEAMRIAFAAYESARERRSVALAPSVP